MDSRNTIKSKPTLEDYIIDMETRPPDNKTMDVWSQLQQKESDLLLAAELGKALLEKNEELKKQQDKLVEEYSNKLETLEQEKHVLRRQYESVANESDATVLELQADIRDLTAKLDAQELLMKQIEKEKNLLIEELSLQNARLSSELQKSNQTEQQLAMQLQEIRDQYNRRTMSIQDHVNSLESLKNELKLILEKKNELEQRLHYSVNEKETLNIALNDATDRIHILERSTREQETNFKMTVQTLDRLERENSTLSERLESFDSQKSIHEPQSLQLELGAEDEGIVKDDKTQPLIVKEAISVYKQLKALCQTLKNTHDDDSGLHSDMSMSSYDNTISSSQQPDSNTEQHYNRGMLSSAADELALIIMNLDAIHFKTLFEQSRGVLIDQEEELKKRQERIMQLESKISGNEIELQSALEERNRAREDASHSSLAQDDLVVEARKDRDAAVERRTKAEVELAKTRVELMQANGQLLEAIQQKVELLQQLEQWQIDMHDLIEEQMKNKLNDTSKVPSPERNTQTPTIKRNRLLDLFYR